MPRNSSTRKSPSPFRVLPCLRCGQLSVGLLVPQPFNQLEHSDLTCKRCGTPHFLAGRKEDGMWWAIYDRDTRRYPSDYYDEQPFIVVRTERTNHAGEDDVPFPNRGPICIFKRRRFSQ